MSSSRRSGSSRSSAARESRGRRDSAAPLPLPALHQAARENRVSDMLDLLASDPTSIDTPTPDKGATALHHACYHGNYLAAELLLERGADANARDKKRRNALHHACFSADRHVIALCLRYGANPKSKESESRMPHQIIPPRGNKSLIDWYKRQVSSDKPMSKNDAKLLTAINDGNELGVIERLDKKADLEVCNKDGVFALTWAVRQGKFDIAEILLLHCADPNQPDSTGNTPLHWAAIKGYPVAARMLVENDALLNVPNKRPIFTPLHAAASKGHVEVVEILLRAGADTEVLDKDDSTPLHWACRQGHLGAVRALVDAGANPNSTDAFGVFPVHFATISGDPQIVKYICRHGGDVNSKTSSFRTPLQTAVVEGNMQMIEMLLRLGARPNIANKDGNVPLHLAIIEMQKQEDPEGKMFFLEILQTLVGAQPDLDIRNKKLQAPIEVLDVNECLKKTTPEFHAALALAAGGCDLHVLLRPPIRQDQKDLVEELRVRMELPDADMPEGWKKKTTKTLRRRDYFVNRETKETQWIDPRIDVVRQQLREREQSSPQNTGVVMDNVTCALCLELYYQPATTPCGHTFCSECISACRQASPNCPMCRTELKDDEFRVNTILAEIIENSFPEAYAARRRDLESIQGTSTS